MSTDRAVRTTHKICSMMGLASLIVLLGIATTARPQEQTDWRQWSATDVHYVLTKSPWVSNCCRKWTGASVGPLDDPTATSGHTASIVSSQMVRQALVRRLQLDKRYETLDKVHREDTDQRIAACLSRKFDDYIVISFDFNFGPDPRFAPVNPSQVDLLTSDGRKIAGQVVADPIAPKCTTLPNDVDKHATASPVWNLGLYGTENELAFPRIVDGNATIGPNDKTIRVELDFYRKSYPGNSIADSEIDFSIGKLIYRGKPDF